MGGLFFCEKFFYNTLIMRKYILKRLIQLLPILFCMTFLTFSLMQFGMIDAADIIYEQSGSVDSAVVEAKRRELGLDRLFLIQYFDWLKSVSKFDLGTSYISGKPVFETFVDKFPATFWLVLISMIFTLAMSIPLGIISAINSNAKIDYIIRFFAFVGNSLPNFFVGLVLMYIFALKLDLFSIIDKTEDFKEVILPAATLAISMTSKYTRQIRALTLEEINKPYVIGAKARGISEFNILKSVLKCVSLTLITLIALSVGSLLGGATVVETVFMWDGVGRLAVNAALMRDYPVLQAYVLFISVVYVVVNLLADIAYYYLDPRVNLEERRR